MKLIDMLVERSLATSRRFIQTVSTINNMAEEITMLRTLVAELANMVSMQQMQINQLIDAHNNEVMAEVRLPDIDKADEKEKPN